LRLGKRLHVFEVCCEELGQIVFHELFRVYILKTELTLKLFKILNLSNCSMQINILRLCLNGAGSLRSHFAHYVQDLKTKKSTFDKNLHLALFLPAKYADRSRKPSKFRF
jgi:hypothetical protein